MKTFLVLSLLLAMVAPVVSFGCVSRLIPLSVYFKNVQLKYPQIEVASDSRGKVRVRIPSRKESVNGIRGEVVEALKTYLRHHFPEGADRVKVESFLTRIAQVLLELKTNGHEWGNKFDPEKSVLMQIEFLPSERLGKLVMSFLDEGAGYNPNDLPHAANLDDPVAHLDVRMKLGLRDGGYGLSIISGLAHEFDRLPGRGSPTTVVFYLDDYAAEL